MIPLELNSSQNIFRGGEWSYLTFDSHNQHPVLSPLFEKGFSPVNVQNPVTGIPPLGSGPGRQHLSRKGTGESDN